MFNGCVVLGTVGRVRLNAPMLPSVCSDAEIEAWNRALMASPTGPR